MIMPKRYKMLKEQIGFWSIEKIKIKNLALEAIYLTRTVLLEQCCQREMPNFPVK